MLNEAAQPGRTTLDQGLASDWSRLMRAAQDGDADSYRRLLHDITPFLRRVLHGRVPGEQIEDVVQDALLTLHRVRHTYDPGRPFVPWLVAIAVRRGIDAGRKRGRVRAHEAGGDALEGLAEPEPDSIPDGIEADRQAHRLRQAVQALPRRQRAAVELVKLHELSIAEAAARSGQSPGAVKVNVHRGIAALRRLMKGAAP